MLEDGCRRCRDEQCWMRVQEVQSQGVLKEGCCAGLKVLEEGFRSCRDEQLWKRSAGLNSAGKALQWVQMGKVLEESL